MVPMKDESTGVAQPQIAPYAAAAMNDTATLTPAATPEPALGRPKKRLDTLDVIRGIALAGILFVNIGPVADLWATPHSTSWNVHVIFDTFFQQRFFPIFTLLFGIGFGMMWNISQARSKHPRLVMFRRVAFLIVLGLGHQFLHPGEALFLYGLGGLIFLLPLTFAPNWLAWTLGIICTIAAAAPSSIFVIPGLLMLGFAIGRGGHIWKIDSLARSYWFFLPILTVLSATGVWLQLQDTATGAYGPVGGITGLLLAATYIFLTAVLMQTPARKALTRIFSPLGRMALTNYLTATLFMLVIEQLKEPLSIPTTGGLTWVPLMVIIILVIQWVWSTIWLRYRAQGPLEQIWRYITWLKWGATSRSIAAQPVTAA